MVLRPAIMFFSQSFLDIFEEGIRNQFGVLINGIHQYPLIFCQVSYACVISCFGPLYPCTNKLAATGHTLKTQKSNVSTLCKATTRVGVAGCEIKAECQGGVGADSMSSLTTAAGERRGSLGVGFENMRRSWITK